mmetsp:Transcript_64164/g.100061  ORF Transcript_64164/g.100061 Transcript_64164/m.100061 type:complete len:99 (+) Transcript_64164:47-343(+)
MQASLGEMKLLLRQTCQSHQQDVVEQNLGQDSDERYRDQVEIGSSDLLSMLRWCASTALLKAGMDELVCKILGLNKSCVRWLSTCLAKSSVLNADFTR